MRKPLSAPACLPRQAQAGLSAQAGTDRALMATRTNLANGNDSVDAASFTIACTTVTNNRLVLAFIAAEDTGSPPTNPTLTGQGLTWVRFATVQIGSTNAIWQLHAFRTMGAGSAGDLTLDFATDTQRNVSWSIFEIDGVDTTGSQGSGAVVQSVTDSSGASTGFDVTALASFADAVNNWCIAAFANRSDDTITVTGGLAQIHQENSGGEGRNLATAEQVGENLTPDATTVASNHWGGIALEVKVSGAAPAATRRRVAFGAGPGARR